MPSALPKMKKYTWYLSMQLNVNRKDYVEKSYLELEYLHSQKFHLKF